DTILFETIRKLLEKALANNLELLPDSLDLIPEHITEFLPFALPIAEYKNTRAVVIMLRKIFFFSQLPSSYFYDNKLPLLLDPKDLTNTNFSFQPDPTAVLCLASRGTKRPTSSYPTRIATESTMTIPIGPNAFFLRLLKHIPITIAPETTTKLNLFSNLKKLTLYIKKNILTISTQVPITDYNTATQMIKEIQDYFKFTLVPNYLIDLLDLLQPD
ncbi:10766_t:CDS:2, partial [Gigaspora margarita]